MDAFYAWGNSSRVLLLLVHGSGFGGKNIFLVQNTIVPRKEKKEKEKLIVGYYKVLNWLCSSKCGV